MLSLFCCVSQNAWRAGLSDTILFCLLFLSCSRASLSTNDKSLVGSAYRWLNSWKEKLLCLRICLAMSLVVVISRQAETISSGDQCWCLTRYPISFSVVSVLSWFEGLETRAQYAISSWTSYSPSDTRYGPGLL